MKKVLGMGNALVDILAKLDDDARLSKLNLPKGSMQLVDEHKQAAVLKAIEDLTKEQASGGSAANTMHGVARLGVPTGYIGKIGQDEFGDFFKNDLELSNIRPYLTYSTTPSGRAVALISQDSERTFATYLGAAVELNVQDLLPEYFKGYDYFHIEGYLVYNHELMETSVKMAKSAGCQISLDCASFNVVQDNLEFLKSFTKNYVDIIFANEEEAKSFTGLEPREALDELSKYCKIAVVKIGAKGSYIKSGNEVYTISSVKANCIDTTGAGDLYAGGFLYGLANDLSLPNCGNIGSLLSGKVVEVIGAKIPDNVWKEIHSSIKSMNG